jgi:hypothetical protein
LHQAALTARSVVRNTLEVMERVSESDQHAALARERLERMESERARIRLGLLAEASRVLAEERPLPVMLDAIASAVRRYVADACTLRIEGPETIRVVRAEETDGEIESAAGRIAEAVQRTARCHATFECAAASPIQPDTVRSLRRYGYGSALVVPILRRSRPAGSVMWLARAERKFGISDLIVAEDLAGRIALCLEALARRAALQSMLDDMQARLDRLSNELRSALPTLVVEIGAIGETTPLVQRALETAAGLSRRASILLEEQPASPFQTAVRSP